MASRLLHATGKVLGRKDSPTHFYHNAFHRLGYSKALSEERIKIIENYTACLEMIAERNWDEGLRIIVAGSRGKGIAVSLGNDTDIIYVQPAVKCFEKPQVASAMETADGVASFELDLDNVPEGYAKLRLITKKEMTNLTDPTKHTFLLDSLNGALVEKNGYQYLRNDCRISAAIENDSEDMKREGWVSVENKLDEKCGPAQPHRFPLPIVGIYISVDYVTAFPCYYPSALAGFCKREMHRAWPSNAVIDAVKESEVLVVPTGEPGREDTLNWRISFTYAERSLVHSFNDTQIKVYAALKMLVKHHLKPKCSSISSYVVKNIVFLVFEKSPSEFAETDFIDLVLQALLVIKDCVSQESLENYMIPSRNMLKDRISETEKADLLHCIDSMIEEGPKVLLRCPLVKEMWSLRDDAGLQKRLTLRDLADQTLYSYLALPHKTHALIEKRLSITKQPYELLKCFIRDVLPVARESIPSDYFNLLRSMKVGEMASLFVEGKNDDWGYMWVECNRSSESSYEHQSNLNKTDMKNLIQEIMQALSTALGELF